MKYIKNNLRSPIFLRLLIDVLLAVAALCGYARTTAGKPAEETYALLGIFTGTYLLIVVLLEIGFRLTGKTTQKEMTEALLPQLGSVNMDFIIRLPQPVLISDESGKIIWYNRRLSSLVEKPSALYGMHFESLTGFSLQDVRNNNEAGIPFSLKEKSFLLRASDLQVRSKKFIVTVLEDRTELEAALRDKIDSIVLVAYIVIDNAGELTQHSQNSTRTAASQVEALLEKWAASMDGILKEYEREKFLLFFDRKHLAAMEENKFEILDHIREIRVGEGGLPMTVSIGISCADGSPAQRAAASAQCLDMALQRGGDQVVLRNEDGTMDFYGGKVKTVQKRTRVRARMMALKLLAEISASSDVLIMMHKFPDFDAIGAAFGIMRLSCFCGVKANIIVNTSDPNFKRCYDRVKHLPDYRSSSLFVHPSEAQNLIGPDTLLVIVDVNNRAQFEVPEIADMVCGEKTVCVDHHRKIAEFEEKPVIEYIEPSASSACELITEMIEQTMQPGILQKEEADVMYAGITLDTKQFVRNTGVRTFSAALFLRGEGAIPSDAQTLFKTDMEDFLSEAKFENGVVLYRDHYAFATGGDTGDRIAAAKAADKLLTVDGIRASFAICDLGENVHISARSAGEINVQLIMERLGGGGHFDAAATVLKNASVEEAIEQLKEAIDDQLAS